MSFSRFPAIMRKETRQAIRDPSTLMIAGLLPIMLIFVIASYLTPPPTAAQLEGLCVDLAASKRREY